MNCFQELLKELDNPYFWMCCDGTFQWGRWWVLQTEWGSSSFANVCRQYIDFLSSAHKEQEGWKWIPSFCLGWEVHCLLCSSWFLRFLTWTEMYHQWFSSFSNEDDICWDFSVSSITWAIPGTCQLLHIYISSIGSIMIIPVFDVG